ncbi:MAG: ATP-binding protein [Bacteroidales bacterium]|nr:ATP-binding protein [Bacteroidales bacterium]
MSTYIKNLIHQGENQQLDFKFEISDAKKIARTIAAFANTDGGKLLIGVKDNGVIAGVRTEEEIYMVELAAHLYCKPPVNFVTNRWIIDRKSVLEIAIPKSEKMPHSAKDTRDKWMVYIRKGDQNLLANRILLEVWKKKKSKKGVLLRYGKIEQILLDYLRTYESVSLSKFMKIANIRRYRAERTLINLATLDIISVELSDKGTQYKLNIKALQENI